MPHLLRLADAGDGPLRDVWPGVELDLLGGFQADPAGLLLDGRADLVITSEAAPRPGIFHAPLFGFEMLALLPPAHPLAARKWLVPGDFADHTLITYPVPEDRLDLIRRVLAPVGIKPPRREAQLTVAILQLSPAAAGWRAAAWAVAPYLERGYVAARRIGKHGLWPSFMPRCAQPTRHAPTSPTSSKP